MMIVSRAKSKWFKPKKVKKLALNSQLLTFQILTNDVQMLILCLSYFITTVTQSEMIPAQFLVVDNLYLKPTTFSIQEQKL